MENVEKSKEVYKGLEFWTEEIKRAGVLGKLRFFNDVITGKEPPHGYGEGPVVADVVIDGMLCDIWHTDHKKDDSYHRIFIQIKE